MSANDRPRFELLAGRWELAGRPLHDGALLEMATTDGWVPMAWHVEDRQPVLTGAGCIVSVFALVRPLRWRIAC